MRFRATVATLLAGVCSLVCGGAFAATPTEPPSVIVILLDTLRPDQLSAYGYERPTSPFLERVARESVVFERAYSPASWTRASTASLFTSRLPESHGCEDRADRLSGSVSTLAEVLAGQGYETLGLVANETVAAEWGFGRGFVSTKPCAATGSMRMQVS